MRNFSKLFGIITIVVVIGFSMVGCDLEGTIDDTRILGTWADTQGHPWKFSSNGKLTYENNSSDIRTYDFSVVNGKLSFNLTNNNSANDTQQTYNISFSGDENTLTLTGGKQVSGWSVAGPGMSSNTLTRR